MSGHSHFATIKRQKAVNDSAKGKIFSKMARAISIAIKAGGNADPESNYKLRMAVDTAKAEGVPKDNIERILIRGASGIEDLEEIRYEGFGPFGVGDYAKVIIKLDSGEEVLFDTHPHRACVTTLDGKYIGRLPDDLSAKLKKFTLAGNKYTVFIKSVDKNEVKVFIREIIRSPKLKDTPSFPADKIDYVTFTPPELVHDSSPSIASEDFEE